MEIHCDGKDCDVIEQVEVASYEFEVMKLIRKGWAFYSLGHQSRAHHLCPSCTNSVFRARVLTKEE